MVNGTVIPIGHFGCLTVDHWKRSAKNVLWAFLTHAHADHLHGLSETWKGMKHHKTHVHAFHRGHKIDRILELCLQQGLRCIVHRPQGNCCYFGGLTSERL